MLRHSNHMLINPVRETDSQTDRERQKQIDRETATQIDTDTDILNRPTAPFSGGTRDSQNPRQTFNGIFIQIYNGLIQSLPILIHSLQCAHKHTRLQSGSMDIHIG